MSADSWCRAAKLPHTFTAEVRLGPNGRVTVTGTPPAADGPVCGCRPLRVPVPGARQGPDVSRHQVRGECVRHRRRGHGRLHGAHARIGGQEHWDRRPPLREGQPFARGWWVGSRPARPAPLRPRLRPTGPRSPCGFDRGGLPGRDADALWKMMSPRLRSEVDSRAARIRGAPRVPPAPHIRVRGSAGGFQGVGVPSHDDDRCGLTDEPLLACQRMGMEPRRPDRRRIRGARRAR